MNKEEYKEAVSKYPTSKMVQPQLAVVHLKNKEIKTMISKYLQKTIPSI
ncbi:hypothetical protein AAAC51_44960 [Priestia megaterium]